MRAFRFGVNLLAMSTGAGWVATCRRAEELGYDVVMVPDHLGMPAPFPALVAAAAATTRPRLGTFVLNVGFWNPVLLARDVATTDQLTGGRLELGLGTGYVHAEFAAAGLDAGTPGDRVDQLTRTVQTLDRLLRDTGQVPRPVQQPRPPLLVGGNGNRVLRLAAAAAEVVAFTGAAYDPAGPAGLRILTADRLAERVAFFAEAAGDRAGQVERNLLLQRVLITPDRDAAIRAQAPRVPHLTVDELLDVPLLLVGTLNQIVDQVRAQRDRYGVSYLTVLEPDMEAFAPVIEALSGT